VDIRELEQKAAEIRSLILEAIVSSQKGHIGGALSCTDILVALYHGGIFRIDPSRPDWQNRDRFILSKGHSGVALFAVLSDLGFFDKGELNTFCQNGSRLGGHPDRRVPGIEADTGSLGHGLGIGAGMALCAKMDCINYLTFVLLGDGECHEGSVWEAFLFAAHHKLNNLVAIIDRNGQGVLDYTEDCMSLTPLKDKLIAFGWDLLEVDGHSFKELIGSFSRLRNNTSLNPLAIIANTVKGKGISFMEGEMKWHHGVPNEKELQIARRELSSEIKLAGKY
jgi:transketolase